MVSVSETVSACVGFYLRFGSYCSAMTVDLSVHPTHAPICALVHAFLLHIFGSDPELSKPDQIHDPSHDFAGPELCQCLIIAYS